MKKVDHHVGKYSDLFEGFANDYAKPSGDTKAREVLGRWMEEARQSEIPKIEAFAAKLSQDIEAVAAAMVWSHSQGQTEGRIKQAQAHQALDVRAG